MSGPPLTAETLAWSYRRGIFPMTVEEGHIEWFLPYHRALFPIGGIHLSRSTLRSAKRAHWRVSFDEDFSGVMRACVRPEDNWLSEPFFEAYGEAHRQGWAHSCEVWEGTELVGGTYGLAIGACFAAESMFHRRTDASKFALAAMINQCQSLGFEIFDAQIMNPHLESLGAYEVSDFEYQSLLAEALKKSTIWSQSR